MIPQAMLQASQQETPQEVSQQEAPQAISQASQQEAPQAIHGLYSRGLHRSRRSLTSRRHQKQRENHRLHSRFPQAGSFFGQEASKQAVSYRPETV